MPTREQSFTIKQLDSLVMTVEPTLVSIVQGVALAVIVAARYEWNGEAMKKNG